MSRARVFVGTRVRQLSDRTGDLQDWLWHLADRIEQAPGGTVPPYHRAVERRTGSRHVGGDILTPLIGGMPRHRCGQGRRIGYLVLTAQQQEALRRVGEQVHAVNRQVNAMREARRKGDGPDGPAAG